MTKGTMLVCENHRDKRWPDECACGPGMLKEHADREARAALASAIATMDRSLREDMWPMMPRMHRG